MDTHQLKLAAATAVWCRPFLAAAVEKGPCSFRCNYRLLEVDDCILGVPAAPAATMRSQLLCLNRDLLQRHSSYPPSCESRAACAITTLPASHPAQQHTRLARASAQSQHYTALWLGRDHVGAKHVMAPVGTQTAVSWSQVVCIPQATSRWLVTAAATACTHADI